MVTVKGAIILTLKVSLAPSRIVSPTPRHPKPSAESSRMLSLPQPEDHALHAVLVSNEVPVEEGVWTFVCQYCLISTF